MDATRKVSTITQPLMALANPTPRWVMVQEPEDDHSKKSCQTTVVVNAEKDELLRKIEADAMKKAFDLIRLNRPGIRTMGKGGKLAGKYNEIRTNINFVWGFNTVAATNYVSVLPIVPASSVEWTNFSGLWDEMIVDGGFWEFATTTITNFTSNTGAVRCGISFDPLVIGTLTSIENCMQHSQHMVFVGANAGTAITQPQAVSKNGCFKFKWRTPPGNARSTASTILYGHDWSSTADVNQVYGYLKPWIPTSGATGVVQYGGTVVLHCRFRSRT
jgi:hypothetical protein